jgi:hypothetical protein
MPSTGAYLNALRTRLLIGKLQVGILPRPHLVPEADSEPFASRL